MFRDALDYYGFVDLGFSGPDFTWHGRRRGELIWERLDRGVANYEWLEKFPMGRVRHIHCFTSDHRPILLTLDPNGEHQRWRWKPFHFKAMWLTDSGRRDIVTRAWECSAEGTPMFIAAKKLKKCKKMLKAWSRDHFGNVQRSIKKLKDQLWRAKEDSVRSGVYNEVACLKSELLVLYDKEEKMWHQRSRIQWLQSGDQNTKFFHGTATQRKRKFFINGLKDDEGVWHEDEDTCARMLNEFYS